MSWVAANLPLIGDYLVAHLAQAAPAIAAALERPVAPVVAVLAAWIYGLAGEAENSLYALDLTGNVALVLGGETPAALAAHSDFLVVALVVWLIA